MATILADGSIRLRNGKIIYADTVIQGSDLIEILPLLVPQPAWPFVSGGGGAAQSGPQGPIGPAGVGGGSQGPQGTQGTQGTQGNQGNAGLGGGALYTSFGNSNMGSNQTRYVGVGSSGLDATESDVQLVITSSGTLQNLSVQPVINTRGDDTVATVRLNGADTAITVTIPAGSTSFIQDLANTVAVVAGDLVSIQFVTGGSGGNFRAIASVEIA